MYNRILKEMLGVYEADQDLSPEVQALVMELVPIQKRIRALEARLLELKDDKKELSGPVIAAMQQLELQNVRIGKILVSFVKGGTTPPSYKAVMDTVRTQLAPAVAKLLDDTYASIGTEKEPYLKIKTESVDEGAWQGIKDFFSKGFEQLVGAVSGALGSIEGMLGLSEAVDRKSTCPKCGKEIWDKAKLGQALNKCWNCGTRFDIPAADYWDFKKPKAPDKMSGVQEAKSPEEELLSKLWTEYEEDFNRIYDERSVTEDDFRDRSPQSFAMSVGGDAIRSMAKKYPSVPRDVWDYINEATGFGYSTVKRSEVLDMLKGIKSVKEAGMYKAKYSDNKKYHPSLWVYYAYNNEDAENEIYKIGKRLGLKDEGSGVMLSSGLADISFGLQGAREDIEKIVRAFKAIDGVKDVDIQESRVNEAHTWVSDLIKSIQGEMQGIADQYKDKSVASDYVPSAPDTSKFKAYVHGKVDFRPFAEQTRGWGANPTVGKIVIGSGLPNSSELHKEIKTQVDNVVSNANARISPSMLQQNKFEVGEETGGSAYSSVFVSLQVKTKERGWVPVYARRYVEA